MSKRITKAMAEIAAEQLAKKVYNQKIEDEKKALVKVTNEMYEKYIPSPVRQCAVEYDKYYSMYSTLISFVTEACDGGRNFKRLPLEFCVPELKPIVLSKEDWKRLDNAEKDVQKLMSECNKYKWEVSEALFGLRTQSRVKEMFPEALPYMNFADTTAVSVDLMKLRSVLNVH